MRVLKTKRTNTLNRMGKTYKHTMENTYITRSKTKMILKKKRVLGPVNLAVNRVDHSSLTALYYVAAARLP